MGKIITIWGSPNSGKTTMSVKLARFIYEKYNAIVTVVCADEITPALPVIFPNKKPMKYFLSAPRFQNLILHRMKS